MPLGLLAKDSIQDLESYGKSLGQQEAERAKLREQQNAGAHPRPRRHRLDKALPQVPDGNDDVLSSGNAPSLKDDDEEEKKSETSPHASSGFRSDYSPADDYYDPDARNFLYSQDTTVAQPLDFWKALMPCLFPWLQSPPRMESQDDTLPPELDDDEKQIPSPCSGRAISEDEISTNSEKFGERLSERDRRAVMARLRLAQPETKLMENEEKPPLPPSKGLIPQSTVGDAMLTKPLKGILKRRSTANVLEADALSKQGPASESKQKRRSLFPSYEGTVKSNPDLKVSFAPMARVVTVKSRNDMAISERGDIWWQRSDYDDFRKTGRIITRAMLAGGSEIWLRDSLKNGTEEEKHVGDDPGDMISSEGDKWWHKFGHSRRGLEHVVSMDEGKQRQANVKHAIDAVLEEQERQRLYNRPDPEKLRAVALHNTLWARDLAFASGSSDADAVKSSFASDRKSREFYLLKMARDNTAKGRHVPEFMQPVMSAYKAPQPSLDAHTASKIHFRNRRLASQDAESMNEILRQTGENKEEHCEEVRDHLDEKKVGESLAHRAAGFTPGNDDKVDMAAVLSGLGAVGAS